MDFSFHPPLCYNLEVKIAIDISPLAVGHNLQHRVRGTGFYLENLKTALLKYYPKNKYIFFVQGDNLPKDIDIVHYPYFEPFFLTLPFLKKNKWVVTVHDLTPFVFPKYFPRGLKGEIKWRIQKMMLRKVNAIITDSQSSKNDIIKYADIDNSKIQVIYLAAGNEFKKIKMSEERKQSLRNKYGLPQQFVLYVGDATWNKNLPRLIEGIKKINVTLVLVGKALAESLEKIDLTNPWNQDLIKVYETTKNDKRIIKLGFVSIENLISLYNLATLFVMPSLYEGFGLPILEAMSCGCPIVTSKEGSIPEVTSDAAFYVDAYDVNSIANGIGEVFFNIGLQNKLSEKGLKQAKKFSWQKTAKETTVLYEKYA